MKAVGFFAAIFLSMLAFFVVATGEFELWLSDDPKTESATDSGSESRTSQKSEKKRNMLDFDFWNVKLGRRNFTIRAELPSGDLEDGSRLDQLEKLQLRDGVIEIPLYDAKDIGPQAGSPEGNESAPEGNRNGNVEVKIRKRDVEEGPGAEETGPKQGKLLLTFDRAVYRRSGGLVRGSGDVSVVLFDGKGTTNDGTEFHFQELLFSNVEPNPGLTAQSGDKSRFSFRSEKSVSIVNPYLEVHSEKGLRGEIGQKGIEKVEFLPPVATYLDPNVIGDFTLGEKTEKNEAPKEGEIPSRAVITCAGGLKLEFGAAGGETKSGEEANQTFDGTRILFTEGVVVFNAAVPPGTVTPPKPRGNRFDCSELTLEIDDEGRRPIPRRAIARSDDGRVRTLIVRGNRTFTLEGDQLEWINLALLDEDGAPKKNADETGDEIGLSEGYLTGSPTLTGPEVDFRAERAVLRPHENSVLLEKVTGTFKRAGRRDGRVRETAARVEGVVQSKLDGGRARKPANSGAIEESKAKKSAELAQVVDFSSDEVELVFDEDSESGQKGLSRFVARGEGPKAVKIHGRGSDDSAEAAKTGAKPFEIGGAELTYDAIKKQVTLVGEKDALPRLTQGASWIEAAAIHLLVDGGPQAAWFEGSVSARLDYRDFRDETKKSGGAEESVEPTHPRVFEIRCSYLGLAFDESRELTSALARGDETTAVRLRTLEGTPYRFVAQEARLLSAEKVVELFSAEDDPDRIARMELEGGVIQATHIHFTEPTRTVALGGAVELRLYEGDEITPKPTVLVRGAEANFVLRDSDEGAARDDATQGDHPLAKLSLVDSLKARGTEERPLVVEGANFELRGEVVEWEAAAEKLVFSGSGLQEILIQNGQLTGPVRARTVPFDAAKSVVLLETNVAGKLQQLPREETGLNSSIRRPGKSKRPMVWEFETSSLEMQLAKSEANSGEAKMSSNALAIEKVTARDKVLLYSPEQAVLLRGDDLIYDAVAERVNVFSRDGRRQTLQHFTHPSAVGRSLAEVTEAGATDPEGPVDTIHAQRIVVHLVEHPTRRNDEGRLRQMLVVQFRKDVIANFYVTGKDDSAAAVADGDKGSAGKHWQVIAQRLTLHVDPQEEASTLAVLPWALAVGTTEGPQGNVTINSGPYQAFAERVEYRAGVKELVLVGSASNPATIVERRAKRGGPMLREEHQVIILRKEGDTVAMESARRVPTREPWPGAPDYGDE